MNTDCPNCGCEDAYFNGVCYECPNCDREWHANGSESIDNDDEDSEDD